MSTDTQAPPDHEIQKLADTVAAETRLSEKQATAYIMREALELENSDIASLLDVASGASASSYVTRAKNKIEDSDKEIQALEQEIEEWEKTKQLSELVDTIKSRTDTNTLSGLSDAVDEVLVDDESHQYLVAYIDGDGDEQVRITDTHPRKIQREVLQYKRIEDIKEVF